MASGPSLGRRPSGLSVVIPFGIAILAAAALIAVAVVAGDDGSSATPTTTPAIDLEGIPQEGAVLGRPTARVALIEYADLQCPACRFYAEEMLPAIVDEYVRPGEVKTEFRGYPFIGPDSVKAQRFVLAAGRQNKLWQLVDALYRYQRGENDGWVTDELIRKRSAEIAGLDVDRLFADAASAEITASAENAVTAAESAGVAGTPTLFVAVGASAPYVLRVSDLDEMREALDDALRG